jgi:hypothetical protein
MIQCVLTLLARKEDLVTCNILRLHAKILHVSIDTVNRDLSVLRQQAKTNIKRYIDERLPEEYEKCLVGLNAITREA